MVVVDFWFQIAIDKSTMRSRSGEPPRTLNKFLHIRVPKWEESDQLRAARQMATRYVKEHKDEGLKYRMIPTKTYEHILQHTTDEYRFIRVEEVI